MRKYIFLFGLWVIGIGVFSYTVIQANEKSVKINDQVISIELAETTEQQQQGLSGREGLDENAGMLFVYDSEQDNLSYWMKDMRFSLDIIWINSNKKIVDIDADLAPETYPDLFSADAPVQYVLEVEAGYAESKGIGVGDTVELDI